MTQMKIFAVAVTMLAVEAVKVTSLVSETQYLGTPTKLDCLQTGKSIWLLTTIALAVKVIINNGSDWYYDGQVDENMLPHGYGQAVEITVQGSSSKAAYNGSWRHGEMHGG